MTGVAAIHNPLCHVNSCARDIRLVINIRHSTHWSGVNSHTQSQSRISPQRFADFQGALHRSFRGGEEHQRHSIASREPNELLGRFSSTESFGFADDLIQLVLRLALIVDQELRVAHDVDKQYVPNLELQIRCAFSGHVASVAYELRSLSISTRLPIRRAQSAIQGQSKEQGANREA